MGGKLESSLKHIAVLCLTLVLGLSLVPQAAFGEVSYDVSLKYKDNVLATQRVTETDFAEGKCKWEGLEAIEIIHQVDPLAALVVGDCDPIVVESKDVTSVIATYRVMVEQQPVEQQQYVKPEENNGSQGLFVQVEEEQAEPMDELDDAIEDVGESVDDAAAESVDDYPAGLLAPQAETQPAGETEGDSSGEPAGETEGDSSGEPAGEATFVQETRTVELGVTVQAVKDEQTITAKNVTMNVDAEDAMVKAETDGDGTLHYEVTAGSDVVSVSNEADKEGMLYARKAGTAAVTITASETDDYYAATKIITITVKPVTYKIVYDKNATDAEGKVLAQDVHVRDVTHKAFTLRSNSFKRTGYSFLYWNTQKNGTGASYYGSQKVTQDMAKAGQSLTLYAQWAKVENTVTLKFDKNAADAKGSMDSISIEKGSITKLPPNAFEREGYQFDGWYLNAECTGNKFVDGQRVRINGGTLYAHWIAKEQKYAIQLSDTVDGTISVDKTEALAGDTVTISSQPAEGFELASLSVTDANGQSIGVTDGTFVMPESNVTVSATFQSTTKYYNVTFTEVEGGTMQADPTTGTTGTVVTLTATPNPGYEFSKWSIRSGKGASIDENELTIGTSDVEVRATFKKIRIFTTIPTVATSSGTKGVECDTDVTYTITQKVPDDATYVGIWLDLNGAEYYAHGADQVNVHVKDGAGIAAQSTIDGQRVFVAVDNPDVVTDLRGQTMQVDFVARVRSDIDLAPYLGTSKTLASIPYKAFSEFHGGEDRTAESKEGNLKVKVASSNGTTSTSSSSSSSSRNGSSSSRNSTSKSSSSSSGSSSSSTKKKAGTPGTGDGVSSAIPMLVLALALLAVGLIARVARGYGR